MKLAYVLGEFPSLSETFILREMFELRRLGFDLAIGALTRPAGGLVHEEAAALLPRVTYRPQLLGCEAIAGMGWCFGRHPVRLLRAAGVMLAGAWPRPVTLARCLRNLPTAAVFARRALGFGADHVHAHFAGLPTDVARAMAILMGTGFSFSAHASDIHCQAPRALAGKVRAARFVAVCTQDGLKVIADGLGGRQPEHVHLVRHGVSPNPVAPSFGRGPSILAVGRLQPKKGFLTLVEACRLLRERGLAFRCVIAGEGPQRRALEAAVADGGLADVMDLAGAQTQAQIGALLQLARVFVLPCVVAPDGDRDGLPNALLEAMAAGVPVVSTTVGGVPEAVDHGRTGLLVPPGDPGALAASLEELLKNDGLCRTLGLSGRALAAERFDTARNVAPLAALFEGVRQTA